MKVFYRPALFYPVVDILILILNYYVVLDWLPLTTRTPFEKYTVASLGYMGIWLFYSYFFRRYRPLKRQQYFWSVLQVFYSSLASFFTALLLLHLFFRTYSGYVLLTVAVGAFILNYIFLSMYYAYLMAVEYNEVSHEPQERISAFCLPSNDLDDETMERVHSTIVKHSSEAVFRFLQKYVNLKSGNTRVYISFEPENLEMMPNYRYSTIVQLEPLNQMRGVNRRLFLLNEKLPDNGIFICCYESKSTRKARFLKKFPKGINVIIYGFDFLFKRVMPKIIITRELYYLITGGKNRIFSKAEVLGRLYCFGFEVLGEYKVNGRNYVYARRRKQPESFHKRTYGPLIRLKRYGKNKQQFEVYKMRTMHPYSEFLQPYIYEHHDLQDGGKFNKDIRITTLGRFMRKYWLDELPMIFNLLNGDMKLVGIRPLSAHYFSLYNAELQDLRSRFKPGLLPPFYADMPVTLDEIQASEMAYLRACEQKGVFRTDLHYFFLILRNIFIKKARSG